MSGLGTAWQFLTILPAPGGADLARAVRWCPLVGLVLGALLVLVDLAMAPFLGPMLRAAIVVAVLALVTGGLHLDGLSDTADGLLGARPPERRIEIMHDPTVGVFGAMAIGLVLLVKFAALAELQGPLRLPALVVMPMLARWVIVMQGRLLRPARPDAGLGPIWRQGSTLPVVAVTGIASIGGSLLLAGTAGLVFTTVAFGLGLLMAWWARQSIGGMSGDIYGATVELAEAAGWVAAVALMRAYV